MNVRSILGGALAVMLLQTAVVDARDGTGEVPVERRSLSVPTPWLDLPGVFNARTREPGTEVRVAQAVTDPRVVALEEQIRALNGTIEELNFQMLQLQEQVRKMQEDNEFRFQELEKRSDASSGTAGRSVAGNGQGAPKAAPEAAAPAPSTVEDVIGGEQTQAIDPATAAASKTFGTIKFDSSGNVVGGGVGDEIKGGAPPATSDQTVVAALPPTDDPEELYRNSYQFVLSGDYGTAETGFRDHIARFPADPRAADAHFWLGEALLGQQKYRDAAEIFLAANKDYPKSKKAPDMLLKLGVSLAGLKQRDVACATFAEVAKRYPTASVALKERVKQEQALAAC